MKKQFFILVIIIISILFGYGDELFNNPDFKFEDFLHEYAQENESQLYVSRVIDGDTIELSNGEKIRYIGINTPETKHPTKGVECFGKKASEYNKNLVEGKEVLFQKDVSDTDRYGRLLRYVYVDDVFVNYELVKNGYAYASSYPPDVSYQELFLEAEKEARENNRGLWAECENE